MAGSSRSSPYRDGDSDGDESGHGSMKGKFALVLPVLFYEYLAISLTKGLIPHMLVNEFQERTYFIVGIMETIKVLISFVYDIYLMVFAVGNSGVRELPSLWQAF
jgi:hypothetical protein